MSNGLLNRLEGIRDASTPRSAARTALWRLDGRHPGHRAVPPPTPW